MGEAETGPQNQAQRGQRLLGNRQGCLHGDIVRGVVFGYKDFCCAVQSLSSKDWGND